MKVGDVVWITIDGFFNIHSLKIIKETTIFFWFKIEGKEKLIRRGKNNCYETKEVLLENKLNLLDANLATIKTNGEEVYLMYKKIYEEIPELLI